MNIEKYKFLWEDEKSDWCLVNTEYGFCIVNKKAQSALSVSDEKLESAIIEKMIECGCRRYDNINEAYKDV